MKSDILKNSIETLPYGALLMSAGLKKEDFSKSFIGGCKQLQQHNPIFI